MAQSIYITAMGPYSGKSVVALGFTEMLSARLQRIGFFRPIIRSATEPDPQIELMRDRYQLQSSYSQMHGPTADAVTALIVHGEHEEIQKQVLTAYRELERHCDFVVCEGTDFVGSAPALDFDLNANLANQLGCPVLVVVNGAASADIVEEVQLAREELQRKDCELFGVIVNRVAPDAVDEVEARLAPNTGQESFGIILLEALATRTPIVASDLDAFKQVLRGGEVGRLFPVGGRVVCHEYRTRAGAGRHHHQEFD